MADTLSQNVLVLNRHWMVIHITSLRRAMCLLFSGYARVVDDDYRTYDFESWRDLSAVADFADPDAPRISSPSLDLLVPEVIQLVHYSRFPPRRVKFSRRNIFLRDASACQYCGQKGPMSELTIDHVLPRAQGGKSTWDNVVVACTRCNTMKGNRTPDQAQMLLRRDPKRPNWIACSLMGGSRRLKPSWNRFIDDAYWNVALQE